jgi:hypothetical protein
LGVRGNRASATMRAGTRYAGQPLRQRAAERITVERTGRDVRDEPRVTTFGAHGRDGLAHARLGAQSRLDLRELDAIAAQLDLGVDSAEVLEVAVGAPSRQVAGS